jgi:kynureninase
MTEVRTEALSDGDAINAAWADVEHQEAKAKATCRTCDARDSLAGFAGKYPNQATVICLTANTTGRVGPTLCAACGQLAIIAGWGPVGIDSDKGRAALKAERTK